MKVFFFSVILLIFLALAVSFGGAQNSASAVDDEKKNAPPSPFAAKTKPPVLVELFTSEGCATCPPADRNLATLEKEQSNPDAEIVTLALHVDYWNRLGWTDAFSSPLYSQRQEIYNDKFKLGAVYTPQMVVDGSRQFVGNNLKEAHKAISEAAKIPKAKIELSVAGDALKVKISELPKRTEIAAVFVAVAEDNLSTEVKKGENAGRALQHVSVARSLLPLGRVVPSDEKFETEAALQIEPKWKREDLRIIVFVQESKSRKILGVARKDF